MSDYASKHLRRNFFLGVTNGFIFMAGSSLLNPTTILPKFLENVFESKALIGVGSYLLMLGWCLPQLPAAYFARSMKHRKPLYIVSNTIRMTLIGLFALSIYLFHGSRATVGVLFFVLLGMSGLAAGLVGLAYQDIVSRTIPPTRRGAYNAYRIFGGQGLTALAGSFMVKYVLDHPEKFPYPYNYVLFFGTAWFLMSTGVSAFSLIKEPADPAVRPRGSVKAFVLELYLILKTNVNYRRFLLQKLLRACEVFAIPYYILFATEVLDLGDSVVGTFQIVGVATMLVAALAWGKVSDKSGNRRVIFRSSVTALLTPILALVLMGLKSAGVFETESLKLSWLSPGLAVGTRTLVVAATSVIFILIATASAGAQIGFQNYIMESAPPRRRPVYLGMTTTIDGLLLVSLPAIGGFLIDWKGYGPCFLAAAAAVAGSAFLALRLCEPRDVVRCR